VSFALVSFLFFTTNQEAILKFPRSFSLGKQKIKRGQNKQDKEIFHSFFGRKEKKKSGA